MNELFQAIHAGSKASQVTQDLTGRTYGIQLAVVAQVEDPLELGRIKALLPSKGGKTLTDWLVRAMPWAGLSVPVLAPGDTVAVAFIDGDPHNGVYLGIIQNVANPSYGSDRWVYTTPSSQTVIDADGSISHTVGSTKFSINAQGGVSFTGVSSFQINGKEVAVIGAKDNKGDALVTRGY